MKNTIEKISLLLVLFFALNEGSAQIQNAWVGGTPGRPTDWNTATNWSLQRTPNEFHDVIIPNTSATTLSYPVIVNGVEIHSLRIESDARVVILRTGNLQLNAFGNPDEVLANAGEIENHSRNPVGLPNSSQEEKANLASTKKF